MKLVAIHIVLAATLLHSSSATEQPNILFILADDLGWSDLGCYGNEIFETPNLDKLAADGIRFTQAYSPAPICSASRAATLTGKTTAQTGFEFVTKNEPGSQSLLAPLLAPPFTLNLDLEETTVAEALLPPGYQAAFFGKWHLNQHYERYLGWSPTHGPKNHGFNMAKEDFGNHPYSYWRKKSDRTFLPTKEGAFPADSLTDQAIQFITADHDDPFFCFLSHFYVHDPVHTRIKWLYEKYLTKLDEKHPRREIFAKYGAMITTLDHHVGQVVDALDESGKRKDTLIVFTSDNGGHPNYAGNAPLRGSKWNLYEGGIRVPMIASWEGRITTGTVSSEAVSSLDLYPTFLALAGLEAGKTLAGASLLPLLTRTTDFNRTKPLVWHFPYYHPEKGYSEAPDSIGINDGFTSKTKPQSAIREGDWKLIYFWESERGELYNLDLDPSEQNNLVYSHSEQADKLGTLLFEYLRKHEARMPVKHPDYRPEL